MSNSIKVLLVTDVEKLGWFGDIVEVRKGYARNYLLSQGLAIVPSEANLKSLAEEKVRRTEQRMQQMDRLERASEAVDGSEAVIAAKANEQGHLFGSVTAGQIAENLRAQGFEVTDEVVQLPGHIKDVGTFVVKLKFTEDLTATVNVVVVAEGQDLTSLNQLEAESKEPEQTGDESEQSDRDG